MDVSNDAIKIPVHIAACPVCEGQLTIDPYEWDESEKPTGYHTLCPTMLLHSNIRDWCEWTLEDGALAEQAIDEWLSVEYASGESAPCDKCGGEANAEDIRDSKLLGTLIRCRGCILRVEPNMTSAYAYAATQGEA